MLRERELVRHALDEGVCEPGSSVGHGQGHGTSAGFSLHSLGTSILDPLSKCLDRS